MSGLEVKRRTSSYVAKQNGRESNHQSQGAHCLPAAQGACNLPIVFTLGLLSSWRSKCASGREGVFHLKKQKAGADGESNVVNLLNLTVSSSRGIVTQSKNLDRRTDVLSRGKLNEGNNSK